MATIANIDLDEENGKGKLEGYLKSADFFEVENNPKATFEETKPFMRPIMPWQPITLSVI